MPDELKILPPLPYPWVPGNTYDSTDMRKYGVRCWDAAIASVHPKEQELIHALQYALSGLRLAYEALQKDFTDEAMLHCGAHEAAAARVLKKHGIDTGS